MATMKRKIVIQHDFVETMISIWADDSYIPSIEEICGVVKVESDVFLRNCWMVYLDPRYDRADVIKEILEL